MHVDSKTCFKINITSHSKSHIVIPIAQLLIMSNQEISHNKEPQQYKRNNDKKTLQYFFFKCLMLMKYDKVPNAHNTVITWNLSEFCHFNIHWLMSSTHPAITCRLTSSTQPAITCRLTSNTRPQAQTGPWPSRLWARSVCCPGPAAGTCSFWCSLGLSRSRMGSH